MINVNEMHFSSLSLKILDGGGVESLLEINLSSLDYFVNVSRSHRLKGTDQEKLLNEDILSQIESEAPFTALEFFNVELSTMTTIVSTVLTYLTILVQFNPTKTNEQDIILQNSTTQSG